MERKGKTQSDIDQSGISVSTEFEGLTVTNYLVNQNLSIHLCISTGFYIEYISSRTHCKTFQR